MRELLILTTFKTKFEIYSLLTTSPGIGGVLKQRYSDFLVHEIDPQGRVVILNSVLPQHKKQQKERAVQKQQVDEEKSSESQSAAHTVKAQEATTQTLLEKEGWRASQELLTHGEYLTGGPKLEASKALYPIIGTGGIRQLLQLVLAVRNDTITEGSGKVISAWKKGERAGQISDESDDKQQFTYDTILPLTTQTKEERTAIHQTVRKYFPFLESMTVTEKGQQKNTRESETSGIRVMLSQKLNKVQLEVSLGFRAAQDNQKAIGSTRSSSTSNANTSRDYDTPEYHHYTLYKVNNDTMSAISRIVKLLRVRQNVFGYAGTKDRRAVTTQRISVHKLDPQRVAGVNHAIPNIRLGDCTPANGPIGLGELFGNRFQLVLRNIDWKPSLLEEVELGPNALQEWAQHSFRFVNYFGLQRFGSQEVPTHYIGRALLRGHIREAITLILRFDLWEVAEESDESRRHPHLSTDVLEILQGCFNDPSHAKTRDTFLRTKNIKSMTRMLPHFSTAEYSLLEGLGRFDLSKPIEAFKCVPRPTRLFYLHSYQSYLWNRLVSERVKRYGEAVTVGDLVTSGSYGDGELDDGDDASEASPGISIAHCITHEDIKTNTYSPEDIVFPIPGDSVRLPEHEINDEALQSILLQEGLLTEASSSTENPFHILNQRIASLNMGRLSGQYRRVFINCTDVAWEMVPYEDPKVPLFDTDLDILSKKNAFTGGSKGNQFQENVNELKASQDKESEYRRNILKSDGDTTRRLQEATWGCKLQLSLPRGCYATMALREIMKSSTRKSDMAELNETDKL